MDQYGETAVVILAHIAKIIANELQICPMSNHNTKCHFDGSIQSRCSICDVIILSENRPCTKEMDGCFLAYSICGVTDQCSKEHINFCYTCSHIELVAEKSLDDFYQQYATKTIQREINKSKTMIENVADKIANGWIISNAINHGCTTQLFAVWNRCLECFDRYNNAPKHGFMIHQYPICNYTQPHYFLCGYCMDRLMPSFYEKTVFVHLSNRLSGSLARLLISFL